MMSIGRTHSYQFIRFQTRFDDVQQIFDWRFNRLAESDITTDKQSSLQCNMLNAALLYQDLFSRLHYFMLHSEETSKHQWTDLYMRVTYVYVRCEFHFTRSSVDRFHWATAFAWITAKQFSVHCRHWLPLEHPFIKALTSGRLFI